MLPAARLPEGDQKCAEGLAGHHQVLLASCPGGCGGPSIDGAGCKNRQGNEEIRQE